MGRPQGCPVVFVEEVRLREIEMRSGTLDELPVDLLALRAPPGRTDLLVELDRQLGGAIARWLDRDDRPGSSDASRLFPGNGSQPHVLILGSKADSGGPEAIRAVAGRAVRCCRDEALASVALLLEDEDLGEAEIQAAAEGLVLGDFAYDALKADDSDRRRPPGPRLACIWGPRAIEGADGAVGIGRRVAEAQNEARSLVSLPGNVLTPTRLAERAESLTEHGLRVETWDAERLRSEGFGALLAVSKGSEEPPRFIIMEHRGNRGAPVALVGKGITFDSGGISLKPSKGMEEMKYDMAGAAAVIGTLQTLAVLKSPQRVIGLVPSAENLPSGDAVKPGDVIRGASGRSIEVINTDAEGRLILSDALTYATRLSPTAIVDIATLTGGCVVALGKQAAGLMSNNDALAQQLLEASDRTGERTWRLPLWKEYRSQLDSDIADIKNSGGRDASPITAGKFLEEFVEGTPWAHLDIAGTAWVEKEAGYQPKGATGFGVRLLVDWVRALR